jgi:YesN/AraC family two-component response regulator
MRATKVGRLRFPNVSTFILAKCTPPQRFDLVITDQTMPVMTGERLARELRRIRADISIVLCTGFSHLIDAQRAAALDISAFCLKPVDLQELAGTIERISGRHEDAEPLFTPFDA